MRYSKLIVAAVISIGVGAILVYTQKPLDVKYDYVINPTGEVNVIIPKGASNPNCGKCYVPSVIKVVLGVNNTVRWTNLDNTPSSVVSDKRFFDSGPILTNQTWSFVFQKAGSFTYRSESHSWMKGEIIVMKKEYAQ